METTFVMKIMHYTPLPSQVIFAPGAPQWGGRPCFCTLIAGPGGGGGASIGVIIGGISAKGTPGLLPIKGLQNDMVPV